MLRSLKMLTSGSETVLTLSWKYFCITDKLYWITPQSTRDNFRIKSRTPHKQWITLRRWAATPSLPLHRLTPRVIHNITDSLSEGMIHFHAELMFHCTNVDLRIYTIVCSANPCKIHSQAWAASFWSLSLYSAALYWRTSKSAINQSLWNNFWPFEVTSL